MIAILLGLMIWANEHIYGPGAISYADLDAVVVNRGWQGTEHFDLLIAPADCKLLGRWAWVIAESGVYSALVVDCESPEHAGQLAARGLLFDGNDRAMVSESAWFVLR